MKYSIMGSCSFQETFTKDKAPSGEKGAHYEESRCKDTGGREKEINR